MINWIFAMSNALHGKNRKLFYFVVVTGMITIRSFICNFISLNHTLEHNFCTGWHLQIIRL